LTGALEFALAVDGSTWLGGSATGCVRFASVCVGGRGRIARDNALGNQAEAGSKLSRIASELLGIVALPLSAQGFTIIPLVGVGAGWTRTSVVTSGDVDALPGNSFGIRAEAALNVGLAVARHFSIIGELGTSVDRPLSSSSNATPIAGASVVAPPAVHFRVGLGCQYIP
jgi:hypothetical protein